MAERKPSDDRAAFGVFPQLQRNRSRQDREAAKNVPVDLARGFVAGVAGAPGDIESFLRIPYDYLRAPTMSELVTGDKTSKTYLPTSEDIEKRLPFKSDTPVSKAATGLGTLGGGFYYGPGSPLKVIGALPGAIKHGAEEFAKASVAGVPYVVKPKGGNWLGGGEKLGIPENDLRRLKRTTTGGTDPANTLNEIRERFTPESIANLPEGAGKEHVLQSIAELEKDVALNKWIDSNLTNYVKREMGTPDDPVRKLAEEGIIHTPLREDLDRMDYLKALRKAEGFPAKGMGKSDLAKQWEALSDDSIRVTKAGAIQDQVNTSAKLKKARAELDAYKKQIDKDFLARMSDHSGNKIFNPRETELLLNQPFVQKAEILGDTKYRQLQGNVNELLAREVGFEKRAGELNPFVAKLDPETRLYSGSTYDLGFDHIMDVLREDVAAGRIRPDQLNKVSMEQAVRRTYEFDQEAAKKMREANFKVTEGFPLQKEYPEGYKWIQLAPPKELPKGYSTILDDVTSSYKVVDENGKEAFPRKPNNLGHINVPYFKTPDEAIADALKRDPRLEEALKYEGETMGHCVGGYCQDVRDGKSKIYSLRDAKGEPHVTIEVQPVEKHPIGYSMSGGKNFPDDFRYESGSIAPEQHQQIYQRAKQLFNPELASDLSSHRMDVFQQAADEVIGKPAEQIIQIKGKQNAKPKEQYLPYVQDFVKGGNWTDIGDLKNTGLFTPQQIIGETTQKVLAQEGVKLPKLMTKAEADDYILQAYKTVAKQTNTNITPPEGMKAGGKVSISKNLDTMMLEVNNLKMAKGGKVVKELLGALKKPDVPPMGINVRTDSKLDLPYADLIVDGQKLYESRKTDSLRPYVNQSMSIVRTGNAPAKAIGSVDIGEPLIVDAKTFREMQDKHLVPEGSMFDIEEAGQKYLYPLTNPRRFEQELEVGRGIKARKVIVPAPDIKKAEGGYIKKPAAYINGDEFVNAAKKYGIKDSMNNLNKIVDLVNKGLSVDDAARQVADSGVHKAAGGAINADDLILEERPL